MSGKLGVTQRKLLYEMNRNGGTYPPAWQTTSGQRAAFEALVRRGMVVPIEVVDEARGQVTTWRLAERDVTDEAYRERVNQFTQAAREAADALSLAQQALVNLIQAAQRVV